MGGELFQPSSRRCTEKVSERDGDLMYPGQEHMHNERQAGRQADRQSSQPVSKLSQQPHRTLAEDEEDE